LSASTDDKAPDCERVHSYAAYSHSKLPCCDAAHYITRGCSLGLTDQSNIIMTKATKPDAARELRTETGSFEADIDTEELQALQDSTDVKFEEENATKAAQRPDNNPYSTLDSLHTLPQKKPRRTLDDMRKLSEEIKQARAEKKVF
jgi:hypothetical protein